MRIECNVTQVCNAVCFGCNKAVGLAKNLLPTMTVDQMRRAVDQLISQSVHVTRFTFCGGEPILHPDLQGLIDEVARLPRLKWGRVLTNGMPVTQARRDRIKLPKNFTWIVNPLDDPADPRSGKNDPTKRGNLRWHLPFWISPADVGMEATWENCTVRTWCGRGLDSSGWSMCGKAVMFGKLLGIDPTMRGGDIWEHVQRPIEDICKHCQYGLPGKPYKRPVRRGPRIGVATLKIEEMHRSGEVPAVSPTFERAFARFAESGPLVQLEEL